LARSRPWLRAEIWAATRPTQPAQPQCDGLTEAARDLQV